MPDIQGADALTLSAAALIAVLTGLGIGSGGLLVIFLTSVCTVPQLEAQSVNLVFFLFSAGASLLIQCARVHIPKAPLALIVSGGAVGSYAGSYLASVADPSVLSSLFGVLLIISGVATCASSFVSSLKSRKIQSKKNSPLQ